MSTDELLYHEAVAEAVADGTLIAVTAAAGRHGFRTPVYVTYDVWLLCVEVRPDAVGLTEDAAVADLLASLREALAGERPLSPRGEFPTEVEEYTGVFTTQLVQVIHSRNDSGPCLLVIPANSQ